MRSKLFLGCVFSLYAGSLLCFAQSPFHESEVRFMKENSTPEIVDVVDELIEAGDEIDATLQNQAEQVTVERGNTLSGLALKLLGDSGRWRDIVEWNYDRYPSLLKNPDLILVGWQLRMGPGRKPAEPVTAGAPAENSIAKAVKEKTAETTSSNESEVVSDSGDTQQIADREAGGGRTDDPLITAESRILHIGDSHTCGFYGKTIDTLLRGTGAAVRTYGVSGSSPSWWLQGTTGKSGYFARDEHGKIDQPADWRTPRTTPDLNFLISDFRPDIIMFSLGANLVYASVEEVKKQVKTVCDIAKAAGCKIIWVGPPNGRATVRDPQEREKLCQNLRSEAEKYGVFIDSRRFTRYPETGGDGVHYWGDEGSRIAREWAGKVFETIQAKK